MKLMADVKEQDEVFVTSLENENSGLKLQDPRSVSYRAWLERILKRSDNRQEVLEKEKKDEKEELRK